MVGGTLRSIRAMLVASIVVLSASSSAWADDPSAGAPQTAPSGARVPEATPAQRDEARARHMRGVELYNEGEYKLALIEFERAYAIAPSYKMLYNIGQVRAQLGHYAKATLAFERFLAEGGSRIAPDRVAEVERDILHAWHTPSRMDQPQQHLRFSP